MGVVIGCVGVVISCVTELEDEDVKEVNEEKEEEEEEEEEEVVGEGVVAPVVTLMYCELKRGWLEFELLVMTRKKMSPRCRFCDGRPSQ